LKEFIFSLTRATFSGHPVTLNFIIVTFCGAYNLWNSLSRSISQTSWYFLPLGSKYSPHNSHPLTFFFLQCKRPSNPPTQQHKQKYRHRLFIIYLLFPGLTKII
jgi:hypothetical protein